MVSEASLVVGSLIGILVFWAGIIVMDRYFPRPLHVLGAVCVVLGLLLLALMVYIWVTGHPPRIFMDFMESIFHAKRYFV